VNRKRATSDQTQSELQGIIRRLKTVITQASNQAAATEAMALRVSPVQAAFYREQAQDLRDMARGVSEVLL
jgi:hypothetical protein